VTVTIMVEPESTGVNVGDQDDDNDGVPDGPDRSRLDPSKCIDSDGDGCDDCALGVDGLGPLPDATPANDGADLDIDGLCDLGDLDDDGDDVFDTEDCAAADATLWATPGDVTGLNLSKAGGTTLTWTAPLNAGGTGGVLYDTVASFAANDFQTGLTCIETDDADTQAVDSTVVSPGQVLHFLIRAVNPCGNGSAGHDGEMLDRVVGDCP
jgi:hypothetical protein